MYADAALLKEPLPDVLLQTKVDMDLLAAAVPEVDARKEPADYLSERALASYRVAPDPRVAEKLSQSLDELPVRLTRIERLD